MGKHRDRLQIIAAILSVAKAGSRKTHIMYQANLSYSLLLRYLNEVIEAGLVVADDNQIYRLTQSGHAFLERFNAYSERCEQLEQQVNHVVDSKKMLETLLTNRLNRHPKKAM